ncbi:NAD(P)-dependent oxidoreductase [Glaciihabitans sp. dw_435]|uniref:NAD-dependent epimerase/dehydratase family protein n=1 Tax=Glaciihabitans sp. dw_435 TaxID=2720081 RepID=UPI001BD5090D|nr:NAD(P)-dependent oxidoreductase [Glaciihabitans sp. dw_435]
MTILITGATGLVGPRLLARLVAAHIDCRVLVRPGKVTPAGADRVEGDILSPETLTAAVDGVTAVIHLAALFRTSDEDQVWKVNLEGTRNVIAAVSETAPHARFLLASTSNVYDASSARPGRENDAIDPTLAYPASKVAAEKLLRASGLTHAILRLPFIYGDGDGHLEALPAQATSMGWHPAQKLSVVHHADVATAFTLALTGAMDGLTVNIADESPLSVYEMAQIVGSAYDTSAEPLAQPWKGQMDISLARSLGFQPTVPTIYQAASRGLL